MVHDLIREIVAPDSYRVSAGPMQLFAVLTDALALCVHDEARGVGGLLHLRYVGGSGRPSDATDIEFSSLLGMLDRFKSELLGESRPSDALQARILAHESPSPQAADDEPDASFVDLLKADLTDAGIACGSQTLRRVEPVYVSFLPREGRVRICAAGDLPGNTARGAAPAVRTR